ncbi:AAA family ATPase [Gemmatimonadota bacterium]
MQKDLKPRGLSTKDRLAQVENQLKNWQSAGGKIEQTAIPGKTKFITISREYGCAGFRIADRLAEVLNLQPAPGLPPWTVYDRKLIDTVCEDHNLSRTLVNSMDTQRNFAFGDIISGMFTGEPSSLQVFKKFAETIFKLAANGRVILIGRGSAVITSKLSGGLHVRLVAPPEWRVKQVAAYESIEDIKAARRHVERNDRERGRFVKDFCAANLKEPHLYDLIFNQQRLGVEVINDLIIKAVKFRDREMKSALKAI